MCGKRYRPVGEGSADCAEDPAAFVAGWNRRIEVDHGADRELHDQKCQRAESVAAQRGYLPRRHSGGATSLGGASQRHCRRLPSRTLVLITRIGTISQRKPKGANGQACCQPALNRPPSTATAISSGSTATTAGRPRVPPRFAEC